MAPLLGRKPYPLVKPLAEPPGPGEAVFTIDHSKEAFKSKEEYEARLQKYSERIWTCKSTGSSQLTHKEAWEEEQEVTELLKEEYPLWFEKPVLEIVHHNTVSLDKLVEKAWIEILTKYAVDEECDFLVGKDKTLRVKVVKVHPLENAQEDVVEKKLDGACDSPSSDKENASQENRKKESGPEEENKRESLSERARRSPRKLPTNVKEEKKRWVMPKFLAHKYDVKLMNEDKVISNVPVDSLYRTERPPNKEIMRYFIRHNATRLGSGESAPWVVEDELVKKYSLPSKFSSFLLDPHKYFAENPTAKRKSLSTDSKATKRQKTAGQEGEMLNGKTEKKNKVPLSPTLWSHMQIKKITGSPLKAKNSGSPKKSDLDGDSDDDVIIVTPGFPKSAKSGKKPSDVRRSRKSGGRNLNQKTPKKVTKGVKSPRMKQMTLLDVAKRRSTASPKKRPRSSSIGTPKLGKPLPPMALHLLRYYKENKGKEDKKNALSSLISKAAKLLSAEDRGRLPEELRALVQKRWELLEHKKRMAAMSEEERQEVLRKKREELKEKLREKAKERRKKEMLVRLEQQRRYEDLELKGRSLPNFKLVDMPDGVPNALFGDVAMVADFLNCYAGLLLPDVQHSMTAGDLLDALASKQMGFECLNRVLVILLQTLLQDELAEGYSELDMELSDIPLSLQSVSELVRLCLRPRDTPAEGSSSEDWEDSDTVVSAEILEKLEVGEVFELAPQEKASLLVALCHRILMTYSLEDHMEAAQQRAVELWKERLATLKQDNVRKRNERKQRKDEKGAKGTDAGGKKEGNGKETGKTQSLLQSVSDELEHEDLISTVKSRRLQAIQAKKDKEEQEKLNKERMEKEAEEERVRKQKASAEKAFQDAVKKAKQVMRRIPLGTDRNHNRYWLFSDVVPGLYIEKGWVHESIDYNFTPSPGKMKEKSEKNEEMEEGKHSQQGTKATMEVSIESSVPKRGQNLWFVIDMPEQLEELMNSLHPQGVREGELKNRLEHRYQDIVRSIGLSRKSTQRSETSEGHQELLNFLRNDICEMASRLQKGGLGYMDDTSEFEEKVHSLEILKDFGECLITLQSSVIKKFLQSFMAPKQKKKRKQGAEESSKTEELDDEKKLAEEARVATAVQKWKTAIREAQTFSRMHVLLGMLDACIKWDMSAENARCKVCRKKAEDDQLILCDECNKAFHLFCLRPALFSIPDGEWLCPACQPATVRRYSRGKNYDETENDEGSEEEEEDEEDGSDDDDEEEGEDEFNVQGHSLRPRKMAKNKTLSSQSKSSKSGSKKVKSGTSRQKASPSSPVDIDELVQQSPKTVLRKEAHALEKCEEILQKLIKNRYSWPFREPVSPEEAEDYLDIISNPMDFQTMLHKFSEGRYRHNADFLEDVKLVFSNAEEYNKPGSTVLSCMVKMEQSFVELLQRLLPGVRYIRRPRRRINRPQASEESEDDEAEEEEEEECPLKSSIHRSSRTIKQEEEVELRSKGRRRGRQTYEESEEEESPAKSSSHRSSRTTKQGEEADLRSKGRLRGRPTYEESEEEEEDSPAKSSSTTTKRDEEAELRSKGRRRGRQTYKESEQDEDEEEEEVRTRRTSRRVAAARKDYQEQESDSEDKPSLRQSKRQKR